MTIELTACTLTAIMGPSGSGRSTLMHLLVGLDRPTVGEVWIGPTRLSALDDGGLTRLRRTRVGLCSRPTTCCRSTARRNGFHVGDPIRIVTGQPVRQFRISGIATLGSTSLGGATFTVFDLPAARTLYGKQGNVHLIYVAGRSGTSPQTPAREIGPLLPAELALQALRESTAPPARGRRQTLRTAFAVLLALVGVIAIFTSSGSSTSRLEQSAIGAVVLVLAIVVLTPLAIGRLARLVSRQLDDETT